MADKAQRYKLQLSKLDFISLVDDPAQPNATTLLIKRKGKTDGVEAVAKYIDADESLGLAWFWAFVSTEKSGEPHYDHHGDHVAADAEMVRAVMDYMKRGGAVDEMHDYEQKSNVVFAMPVTAEVAKAIGIQQTGLLVTIKCTPGQIEKLKDGTFTGVSIAGLGTRELVDACKSIGAKPVRKSVSLFTDSVDGHAHQIDIGDDGYIWCSYATSAGAENGHSHAVARDANGAVVILDDSGHSHQLADGQPAVIVVPEGAVVVTEVAMRRLPIASAPTTNAAAAQKRAGDSPRSQTSTNLSSHTEKSTMTTQDNAQITDLEKQVVSLTKRADRAERVTKLSGAEKAFFDTLASDAQDEFLAKSNADRAAAMAADAVEFELDGVPYRKSTQGYALAKRLRDEVEKNERAEVEKQALKYLGNVGGESAAHFAIVKAIRRSGESAEMQTKMLDVLSGANAIAKGRMVPAGGDGSDLVEKTASDKLAALVEKHATEKSVDHPTAWAAVMKTAEGKRLYAESVGRA